MEKNEILVRARKVFGEVFQGHGAEVTENTTAADIEEWDSLTNIELMVAMEEAFNIKFTSADVSNLRNVGDLVRVLQTKMPA